MPKHKSETFALNQIIGAMDDDNLAEWWKVMGVDLPDYDPKDVKEFMSVEVAYLQEHGHDLYLVSWPDHVINPRFNSDASYQLIMSDKHNRMAWQWAVNNQGFTGTYEDWKELDDDERQQYEDGAAGIGTV